MFRRIVACSWLSFALCAVACSSSDGDEAGDIDRCEDHEPGTDFAPCKNDSDCYSGFCDETGNPGPYCWSSSSALAEGRGIACSSSEDCPLSDAAAKIGIGAACSGSNIAQNSCGYSCKPDLAGGGATNAGGTSSTAGTKSGDAGSMSTGNTGGTGGD